MRTVALSAVVVSAFALLAAGCGSGGSSPSVASVTSTTTPAATTPGHGGLVAFSHCMRTHGVPGFPEPQHFAGGNVKLTIHSYGTPTPTSTFEAALQACGTLLPPGPSSQQTEQQQRRQLADALSFARCMRSHGVSGFPDPNGQGQLTVEMVEAQGIDVHSPQILRVVQTCIPASHGGLTVAKVREAIANAGG